MDAPAVQRLRDSGAILIGQTTTPEFGWKALTDSPLYGVTRNPWQSAYAAGGSSGGAAVAAACGAGVLHLGTDGGGSIRIPAAFSGVAGFKPTFGRVPAYPPSVFGTVAHLGPLARCVSDLRSMLRIMAGRDARDWSQGVGALPPLSAAISTSLKGLRVGLWLRPASGSTDPLIEALACRVARWLEVQGARIEPFELPPFDLLGIFQTHWFSAAANRIADIPSSLHAQMDPSLLRIVELGKRYSAQNLAAAQATRAEFGRQMDEALERFDFLLSPATLMVE